MTVRLVHPEGVHKVEEVHAQIAVAQGSTTVYMAGQVSWDVEGNLVGPDDLAAQAEQCYLNIAAALAGAGAGPEDIAKVTAYVVDLDATKTAQWTAGRRRAAEKLGVDFRHPVTIVGVTSLFETGYLTEVEAIAVLT